MKRAGINLKVRFDNMTKIFHLSFNEERKGRAQWVADKVLTSKGAAIISQHGNTSDIIPPINHTERSGS